MENIAAKRQELQQLAPVGGDIDLVKTQLEEYKVRHSHVIVCIIMIWIMSRITTIFVSYTYLSSATNQKTDQSIQTAKL